MFETMDKHDWVQLRAPIVHFGLSSWAWYTNGDDRSKEKYFQYRICLHQQFHYTIMIFFRRSIIDYICTSENVYNECKEKEKGKLAQRRRVWNIMAMVWSWPSSWNFFNFSASILLKAVELNLSPLDSSGTKSTTSICKSNKYLSLYGTWHEK